MRICLGQQLESNTSEERDRGFAKLAANTHTCACLGNASRNWNVSRGHERLRIAGLRPGSLGSRPCRFGDRRSGARPVPGRSGLKVKETGGISWAFLAIERAAGRDCPRPGMVHSPRASEPRLPCLPRHWENAKSMSNRGWRSGGLSPSQSGSNNFSRNQPGCRSLGGAGEVAGHIAGDADPRRALVGQAEGGVPRGGAIHAGDAFGDQIRGGGVVRGPDVGAGDLRVLRTPVRSQGGRWLAAAIRVRQTV